MLAGTGVSTRFYHILGLRSFRLRELSGLETSLPVGRPSLAWAPAAKNIGIPKLKPRSRVLSDSAVVTSFAPPIPPALALISLCSSLREVARAPVFGQSREGRSWRDVFAAT
jgi:hypothetical protein